MHPWIAAIHPSWKTTVSAWLTTRVGLWLLLCMQGKPPVPVWEAGSPATPMWALLRGAAGLLGSVAPLWWGRPASGWAVAALGEVAVFGLLWGVYQLARRDALPQTAERAVWLAAVCPLMLWTLPASPWTFAAALVAVASALVFQGYLYGALACVLLAMAFRLEVLLLAPGLAMFGWTVYRPGKDHPGEPWALTFGPLVAMPGLVMLAVLCAGRGGVSIRALSDVAWRSGWRWEGALAHVGGFAIVAATLAICLMLAHSWSKLPRAMVVMLAPALAWPLALADPLQATGLWLATIPLFVLLSRIAEDPVIERPLLLASALTSAILLSA